jgi:hypothetical protein
VVLQFVGWVGDNSLPIKTVCNKMLHRALDLAGSYKLSNRASGFVKDGECLD